MKWATGLATFDSLESFFAAAAPDARRRSPEMDFGAWWWEGLQGHSDQWSVSAIERTGEIYANCVRPSSGVSSGGIVLIGTLGPDIGYAKAEACLLGWENECGKSESLQWVVDRVAAAVGRGDRVPTPATFGELAGTVVLLLEALRPWDVHGPRVRSAAAEVTLVLARLPEGAENDDASDAPYEVGFRDGITAHAHWNDGVQYVGTTGRTLKDALENVRDTWNFSPPSREAVPRVAGSPDRG